MLSIIIVNWNTPGLTLACVESLLVTPPALEHEIVLVDNGSDDDSLMRLRDLPSPVRVVALAHNSGFAAGNNAGLAASCGQTLVLLNSDTVVPAGALDMLVAFLRDHPRAGACGPRLVQADGSPQPFAFGEAPSPGYLMRRAINAALRRRSLHDWSTEQTLTVGFVAGTCLCLRRAALEETGPLDPGYFMYFEDVDWCTRARHKGWTIHYVPAAAVLHVGGASARHNPAATDAYAASLRYYYRKHYGPLSRLWLRLSWPVYNRLVRRAPA
jgi:hypothetical protein